MNAVLMPPVTAAGRSSQVAPAKGEMAVEGALPRSSEISDTIRTILGAIATFGQDAHQAMNGQKTKRFPAGLGPTHGTDRIVVAALLKNLSPIEERLTNAMADLSKGVLSAKDVAAVIMRSEACLGLLDDTSRRQAQTVLNSLA